MKSTVRAASFASIGALALVILIGNHTEAQTPVARPSITAMGPMVPVQIKIAGLTSSGFTWNPLSHLTQFAVAQNNPGGDVYLGQSQRDRAGKLIVGSIAAGSTPQVTIQDSTGFVVASGLGAAASNPLIANTTYSLDVLSGAWLQGGLKISCTDTTSGVDCAKINAELFWQQ